MKGGPSRDSVRRGTDRQDSGKANVPTSRSEKVRGKRRQTDTDVAAVNSGAVEEVAMEAPTIDLERIRKKMHHAFRSVSTASKTARKFESQRLIKRLKAAKEAEKPSIEKELQAVKGLDHRQVAANVLIAKLAKKRLLPRGADVDDRYRQPKEGIDDWPILVGIWDDELLSSRWISPEEKATLPDAEVKARAKVASNKTLAEECGKMVETLATLVALGQGNDGTPDNNANNLESVDISLPGQEGEDDSAEKKPDTQKSSLAQSDNDERVWSGSEAEVSDIDEEDLVYSSGEEEDSALSEEAITAQIEQMGDLGQWDHLLGEASEDEDGACSLQPDQSEQRKRKRSQNSTDSESEGSSSVDRASASGEAPQNKRSCRKNGKAEVQDIASHSSDSEGADVADDDDADDSTEDGSADDSAGEENSESGEEGPNFPALSHGFLTHSLRTRDDDFSGGESDDDDFEDDIEDRLPTAKGAKSSKDRKNRMGQRARKALWEKKYGRNANHIKIKEKEKRAKPSQNPSRDGRAGPVQPLRRGRNGQVLPEFVEPTTTDSGWKKFPVAPSALPAPEASKRTVASTGKTRPAEQGPRAHRASQGNYTHNRTPRPTAEKQRPPEAEMHPSWVAKQKQKEREEAIARALAGGQGGRGSGGGKKIVFD
ncbi:unnamed protein product [Parajaminaea phylloscopi]